MTDTNQKVQDEKTTTPVVAAEAASADESKTATLNGSTVEAKVEEKKVV